MNVILIAIGVPVCVAFGASTMVFARERTARSLVQLLGATFLVAVVSFHVAEAFGLFPSMGWGLPGSAGHYLDLISAVAGLVLFPIGLLSRRLAKRRI